MTKAEACERFLARARLAGNPPVSMMAVHHKTGGKMAETYWVLKTEAGTYLARPTFGPTFTRYREHAAQFMTVAEARKHIPDGGPLRAVRVRLKTHLAAARQGRIRDALDALTSVERTAVAIRRCLEGPSPGFPLFTPDLLRAALALEHSAAAHHALAEADK